MIITDEVMSSVGLARLADAVLQSFFELHKKSTDFEWTIPILEAAVFRRTVKVLLEHHLSTSKVVGEVNTLLKLLGSTMALRAQGLEEFHFQDYNDFPQFRHVEATVLLEEAAELIKRESNHLAEQILKLIEIIEQRVMEHHMPPMFPTVSEGTASKRGKGKLHVRAELIRAIDPVIPLSILNRLSLIRDLVKITGIKCSSQHVESALEYRKRP